MFLRFTKYENDIICFFEEVTPQWTALLENQIRNSTIRRENMKSSYFVDFNVSRQVAPIPCDIEIPVDIIIGETIIPQEQILCHVNGHIVTKAQSFFVRDESAFGIRLHFRSGYLNELEVYSLSGERICFKGIEKKNRTYIVYENWDIVTKN